MPYRVKEMYYTLQGEGRNAGRPAVFCRFTGCNLWTGLERDRATAVCQFCDTDFVGTDGPGGDRFPTAAAVAQALGALWPQGAAMTGPPLVVFTGGEPLLQLDRDLIDAAHAAGFEVAVETNGTIEPPAGIDWVCVSPKAGAELVACSGNELKLVYPQPGAEPERYANLDFDHFYLQPMDGPDVAAHTRRAVEFRLAHPQWRLSLQAHKVLGIP